MNDETANSAVPSTADAASDKPLGDVIALDKRVRLLEDAVAGFDERVAERVAERVVRRLESLIPAVADKIAAAIPAPPPQVVSEPPPPPAPEEKPPPAPPPAPPPSERPSERPSRRRSSHRWLFFDMFASARTMLVMIFDGRYAMAWTTYLVVCLLVPAILTSQWWFPLAWLPGIVGDWLDKILDLLLALCVYKALSREARRYQETLDRKR